jgi:serine/threonine-protein kinase
MVVCPGCSKECEETHRFCPSCGFPVGEVTRSTEDPLIGRTLPGGYVVLELVGVGGMGRVYRGEQQALGRTVAVKVIHQHLLGDEGTAARFITEARAASRLNHPNSVGVIDFGKTDLGAPYLVMEFLRGRDLARVLYDEGPLGIRRSVEIVKQVLAALGEAHDLGIIHRDLKPENIILEARRGGGDFVKVVDFGLAKMRSEPMATNVTRPGIVCGTPDYMAPEQGRGDELDSRADLYAVGVILFLLLTNRLPFEADSPTQVVLMHLSVAPPDPRRVAPERAIPDVLAELCLKALGKAADDRFQSADDFIAALEEAQRVTDNDNRPVSSDMTACASCGANNPRGQKFCGECGVRLTKSISAEELARAFGSRTATDSRRPIRVSSWPKFPLPLTHRGDDLLWLGDRLREVSGSLVGARIVAEEGMGKSRLVSEFLAQSADAGDIVVQTGTDPWWADVGYFALRGAISGLAALPETGGSPRDWTGANTEARRGLSEIFSQGDPATAEFLRPEDRRYLAAEALRWALVRASHLGTGRRVVLFIEDLHRVDGASRNAFADALGEPPLAPVLVLATHVPGFDAGWGASAAARVLGGIPPAIATELLRGRGSAAPAPPDQEVRGVPPLYIEQLIRYARDGGTDPPPRLADLLALRVEHTPPDARRTLQAVAVLGDAATKAQVKRLVPEDVQIDPTCTVLMRGGLIEPTPTGVRIPHPLLREVVSAMIPAAVRRELHAEAVRIAHDDGLPLEVKAIHALSAQDTFEALLLLEQTATLATARGDVSGSVVALRRGLDLARLEFFRGDLDDPTRAVVIFGRKLGEALTQLGNFTDADGVLREALDHTPPTGLERARVLAALATVAHDRARDGEAIELLREAIDLANRDGARELAERLEDMRAGLAG